MKKQLQASGNGWQIYLSKPILQLLGYNPKEVRLLITANDKVLYVEPVTNPENFPNGLIKKLYKSGGSYGLYIALPLLELLDINPETDFVEICIIKNTMTIKKAN